MALDSTEIGNIANLARLAIEEKDVPEYQKNLSSILDLAGQMQSVNTDNVEPMAHPMDAVQRLRADEVTEVNQREALQAVAPATEEGLFLVPKVIE
jgi:aspartyl-tRNA(Asn)/glutamyl-tRNA(Gln) amidotransferase subunit C